MSNLLSCETWWKAISTYREGCHSRCHCVVVQQVRYKSISYAAIGVKRPSHISLKKIHQIRCSWNTKLEDFVNQDYLDLLGEEFRIAWCCEESVLRIGTKGHFPFDISIAFPHMWFIPARNHTVMALEIPLIYARYHRMTRRKKRSLLRYGVCLQGVCKANIKGERTNYSPSISSLFSR